MLKEEFGIKERWDNFPIIVNKQDVENKTKDHKNIPDFVFPPDHLYLYNIQDSECLINNRIDSHKHVLKDKHVKYFSYNDRTGEVTEFSSRKQAIAWIKEYFDINSLIISQQSFINEL